MWQELIREDEPIEVVFVSEDSSPEELLTYMREGHGDWLAVQHGANLGRYIAYFCYHILETDFNSPQRCQKKFVLDCVNPPSGRGPRSRNLGQIF